MVAKNDGLRKSESIIILNEDDLIYAMGGDQDISCPMLTSCGTFGECNQKCTVDGIKVPIIA